MSQETQALAKLGIANLLTNIFQSNNDALDKLNKIISEIDLGIKNKKQLKTELKKTPELIARLSGDRSTRRHLTKCINTLLDQLDEEYEYRPYTQTCVRNVNKAMNRAISEHFGIKEDVLLNAIVTIFKTKGFLDSQTLIPESFYDMVRGVKEDDYDEDYS